MLTAADMPCRLTFRRMVSLLPAAVVATGLVALAPPAAADPVEPGCGLSCRDGDDADASVEDGYVEITVRRSTTLSGEDGGETETIGVWHRPPCYYRQWENGVYAWEHYQDHERFYVMDYGGDIDWEALFEEHKDDEEGYWWLRECSSLYYNGTLGEFLDYSQEWFAENPPMYVFPGEPIPEPDIPPEVLLEVAHDAMELPDPDVSWNPQRAGDGATLVNIETWFWLDDGPVQMWVEAEAGGNTARVDAEISEMGFSAPTAEPVTCTGFGTEWSPGAETDCALVFQRSSANQPGEVTPVSAQSYWTIEWFANGVSQGFLEEQVTEDEFEVPVAEVQTRVVD